MPLADDISILHRPIGFAVGINREEEIDRKEQRERLPGLLRFVRTFAGQVLEQEFGTTIEGYPVAARTKTDNLRVGGETWIAGSYDPDLDLTYWGVAQAKPWMRASRGTTNFDNVLYTSSTVALRPSTLTARSTWRSVK